MYSNLKCYNIHNSSSKTREQSLLCACVCVYLAAYTGKLQPHAVCTRIRLEKQNYDREEVIRNYERTIQYLNSQL